MVNQLVIDLYCGLGGWAQGFLAEGYDVIGFDIERHRYPKRQVTLGPESTKSMAGKDRHGKAQITDEWEEYPGQLVLQDVLTLHGRQFKDATVIVASPPCQAYSYRAMPWKRAKDMPPPDNTLFEACFRIQREACEATGRHIPLIVENVRGACKWLGKAKWHFGSYYLWGDVPALMPITRHIKGLAEGVKQGGDWWNSEARANGAMARFGNHSFARKAASAMIAKIPFPLAQHIARVFKKY